MLKLIRTIFLFLSPIGLLISGCKDKPDDRSFPIQVFLSIPGGDTPQDLRLNTAPSDFVMYPTFNRNKPKIRGAFATWSFQADKPVIVDAIKLLGPEFKFALLEPGDSIVIARKDNLYQFSGRGFEKLQLLRDINTMQKQKRNPGNEDYTTAYSLADFEEWNEYSNEVSEGADSILGLYVDKIAYPTFNLIKEYIYSDIEYKRITKFGALVQHKDTLHVSSDTLERTFDDIVAHSNWKWLSSYTGNPSNYITYYNLVRRQAQRIHHFNLKNDTLSTVVRKVEYAKLIQDNFDGYVEEAALTFLVADQGMKDYWYKEGKDEPVIDSLLKAYYTRPGYEGYKAYMRQYEAKIRKWIVDKKKREQNKV